MITDRLGKELLFFDGGMGTLLQEKGLAPGELPETWNISRPEVIKEIHKRYIEAGSDIVLTNTLLHGRSDGIFVTELGDADLEALVGLGPGKHLGVIGG